MSKRTLLNEQEIQVILQRLTCQLIENHTDFKNTVLIGIQPRGVFLANRIQSILQEELKEMLLPLENWTLLFTEMTLEEAIKF